MLIKVFLVFFKVLKLWQNFPNCFLQTWWNFAKKRIHFHPWEFQPNTFDLAWHCMWILSKYFWSSMTLHGNFVQILLIWHGIAHEIHPNTLMHDIACEFHPSTLVHGIACEISSTYFDPNDIACVFPMDIMNSSAICKSSNVYIFSFLFGDFLKKNLQQESLAYGILTSKISSKWSTWILSIRTDHNCMILHRFYFYFYLIFFWVGCVFLLICSIPSISI